MGFQTTTKMHIIVIVMCDRIFIVADLLKFPRAEFISSQNIPMFLKCLLFPYYSTILWEHIVLRPSCMWQKYHLRMLDCVLGCRNMCHGQSQSATNQYTELESAKHNSQLVFALFTEVLKEQNFYPDSKSITQYSGFVWNRLHFSPQQLVQHCGFDLV